VDIPATWTGYVYIPVTAAGVDPATLMGFAVDVAFVSETAEPASGDWKAATFVADPATTRPAARLLVTAGDYPAALYMAWVRVHAPPEMPVIRSGRVRVGDTRGTAP